VTFCETEQGGGYACVLDKDVTGDPVCVERCDVRFLENCESANSEVYKCDDKEFPSSISTSPPYHSCVQDLSEVGEDCGKILDEKSCRAYTGRDCKI
jgi:hypothetical protein